MNIHLQLVGIECNKDGACQVSMRPQPGMVGRLRRGSVRKAVQGGGGQCEARGTRVGECSRHQNTQGSEVRS